jgi:hypothetical protein
MACNVCRHRRNIDLCLIQHSSAFRTNPGFAHEHFSKLSGTVGDVGSTQEI